MAKDKPTKQHYVPQCYLREFADSTTPAGKEPFVWIFDKHGKNKRRDKVKNVLASNDLYTIKVQGKKNYAIEQTLGDLEGKYAEVFRTTIKDKQPLSEEQHVILCAFISAMLQRTLRHKDNLERFYDELIFTAEAFEIAHHLPPERSQELKAHKQDAHKLGVFQFLPNITDLLFQMNLAFLCAEKGTRFITSDDPCNLFNPDLQWQKFYGPGLGQRNIEVTLPLSPEIMLCMSWGNLRGYIKWERRRVDETNRLIVGHCYKYFISHSPKTKLIWFSKYPKNLPFIVKVFKHKLKDWYDIYIRRR
jgi:hypothetical protein